MSGGHFIRFQLWGQNLSNKQIGYFGVGHILERRMPHSIRLLLSSHNERAAAGAEQVHLHRLPPDPILSRLHPGCMVRAPAPVHHREGFVWGQPESLQHPRHQRYVRRQEREGRTDGGGCCAGYERDREPGRDGGHYYCGEVK